MRGDLNGDLGHLLNHLCDHLNYLPGDLGHILGYLGGLPSHIDHLGDFGHLFDLLGDPGQFLDHLSAGVSILRYINISILIKYSNFSGFYKKLGPFYKKLRCDKFGN